MFVDLRWSNIFTDVMINLKNHVNRICAENTFGLIPRVERAH